MYSEKLHLEMVTLLTQDKWKQTESYSLQLQLFVHHNYTVPEMLPEKVTPLVQAY